MNSEKEYICILYKNVKKGHIKNNKNDIYFSLDGEVHLDNPDTLKLLISHNRYPMF